MSRRGATWFLCLAVLCLTYSSGAAPFRLDSDEFPMGMFSVDSAQAMDQVVKMGLTYVHTYAMGGGNGPEDIARDLAYMDQAHERGLKVIFNLGGRQWAAMENGVAEMMVLVNAFKDHPALGFWYFYDEPDGNHTPGELKPFYLALKKATPDIPVAIAEAWTEKWYSFTDVQDLLMIDTYPVQHKPFPKSDLNVMTQFTDKALALGQPVMPINQCFNWKVFGKGKETYRNSPVSELRFPTAAEIRYWCFSGAAQGIRGMFWWSHTRSIQVDKDWVNGEFAGVAREFRKFVDLVEPVHKPTILKRARDDNFLIAIWRRPTGTFLVAVNGSPLEQPLIQGLEGEVTAATLLPWGSTRPTDARICEGRLEGGIARPWEVFVWKVVEASQAAHRSYHEISFTAEKQPPLPGDFQGLEVVFTRPDGSEAVVDGFHAGGHSFKARAYCDMPGTWRWRSKAKDPGLDDKHGTFLVTPSDLPGKLRIHPDDPHQMQYDNGAWFLHIGDTGYRYVTRSEPHWQAYIDQAARMGATKIRTWFCENGTDVQALFAKDRQGLDLAYWAEMDRRLCYALEKYPHIQFQLIPYGNDAKELWRYASGDRMARLVARYAQARFSALPNVHWCISNDCEIIQDGRPAGRRVLYGTIDTIGKEMKAHEVWGSLLTNHQSRFSGYSFVDAPWSDIVTLEDLDQVEGALIGEYLKKGNAPVIVDEDRYELYRQPAHPRYFFRRLMWASLLSGGSATYGGLKTYEAFDGELAGVQGYFDHSDTLEGADDFLHIRRFFKNTGLSLAGMRPDDQALSIEPAQGKCMHGGDTYMIYLANPDDRVPETANAGTKPPVVILKLPEDTFGLRWFNPSNGSWQDGGSVRGPQARLEAPSGGDWVGLLGAQRQFEVEDTRKTKGVLIDDWQGKGSFHNFR